MRLPTKLFVVGGALAGAAALVTWFLRRRDSDFEEYITPLDLEDPDVYVEEVTIYGIADVDPTETTQVAGEGIDLEPNVRAYKPY